MYFVRDDELVPAGVMPVTVVNEGSEVSQFVVDGQTCS